MKRRNLYSLYHQVATKGNIGRLVPFMRLEVAPGDTWSGKVGLLIRLSPLKKALLMDLHVDCYVFFCPYRLVDANWEDFVAAGPNNTGIPSLPTITSSMPHLFMPKTTAHANIAYPNRIYNLIWNEFFRDQQWQAAVSADTVFSTCLSVLPKRKYWNELRQIEETGTAAQISIDDSGGAGNHFALAEDVLRAIAEQKLQMRRATYGTRYVDILRSYGVSVNYQMLQRPELVASAHGSINVTDVVATDSGAGLGTLAGYGVSGSRIRIRRKSFPEHGQLMGVLCVRPAYVDNYAIDYLDKAHGYQGYYDPALELMPNVELQAQDMTAGTCNNASAVIGYMPWGEWYRQAVNRVHEDVRSWVPEFNGYGSAVAETQDWDEDIRHAVYPDTNAIFNDTTYGHFQVSAVNALKALRLISRGNKAIQHGST